MASTRKEIPIAIRDLVIQDWKGGQKGGLSQRQIGTKYKLARTTIQTIIKNFRANGSVQNKVRSGRKPILAHREVRHVLNKVNVTPSLSAPQLSTEIKEMFDKQVSPRTIQRTLNKGNLKSHRARHRGHYQPCSNSHIPHPQWGDEDITTEYLIYEPHPHGCAPRRLFDLNGTMSYDVSFFSARRADFDGIPKLGNPYPPVGVVLTGRRDLDRIFRILKPHPSWCGVQRLEAVFSDFKFPPHRNSTACIILFRIVFHRNPFVELRKMIRFRRFHTTVYTTVYGIKSKPRCRAEKNDISHDMVPLKSKSRRRPHPLGVWHCITLGILLVFIPCQFPFLESFFLPKDLCTFSPNHLTDCKSLSLVVARLILIIADAFILGHVYAIGVTYILVVLLAGILFLWVNSCRTFTQKNADLRSYRRLQALESVLNSCTRHRIFPIVSLGFPAVQILDVFLLIRYHEGMNYSLLFMLIVQYSQCFVCSSMLFIFAGKVYSNSVTWLGMRTRVVAKMERGGSNVERKVERKFLKSLAPLKLWFGSNFMDTLTPLVIEQFCILQTINLLLLQ
ncbi:hypothetical protein Fcan01_23994 [Folsomia candida]|uniref:Uncharacterized protein n=1 Tax=Folsomia candida TaxID=158441 RepID=A0A226D936_FOLCA|nr:hypothetical protein Fcan01_23994 [Folsomia candida]